MAGTMNKSDAATRPDLVTARTPVGPKDVADTKSQGSAAVTDAVLIIAIAWAILFALVFSLRAHNI